MGYPRQLPGHRRPPSDGKGDKRCSSCGRQFSHYAIRKKRGKRIKVCPYCGEPA